MCDLCPLSLCCQKDVRGPMNVHEALSRPNSSKSRRSAVCPLVDFEMKERSFCFSLVYVPSARVVTEECCLAR
jgi:hypothetical protein